MRKKKSSSTLKMSMRLKIKPKKKMNLRTKKTNLYQQKQLIQYDSHPVQNPKPKLKVKKMMKYSSMDKVIVHESKKEHTEI